MSKHLDKIENYLEELGFSISDEDTAEELVVINDKEKGINNLVIDCEDPILIIETKNYGSS